MKKGLIYIKENWLAGIFILIAVNWLIGIVMDPWGIVTLIGTLALVVVGSFLSKRIFKLNNNGPIPWYGSPILWISIVFVCVIAYWYASNT
ncbi:MAG: hypothetical protein JKY14_02745 [Paraglaciecola sp.]|nr:hypothetical protein [Paraglaciecola sp.]